MAVKLCGHRIHRPSVFSLSGSFALDCEKRLRRENWAHRMHIRQNSYARPNARRASGTQCMRHITDEFRHVRFTRPLLGEIRSQVGVGIGIGSQPVGFYSRSAMRPVPSPVGSGRYLATVIVLDLLSSSVPKVSTGNTTPSSTRALRRAASRPAPQGARP
jgi:hypothetical protein